MTKYFLGSLLLCLFLEIKGNVFQDPGKFVEKYEDRSDWKYYKKGDKDFHGIRVNLEKDVHYPHYQNTYGENYYKPEDSHGWRNKYADDSFMEDVQDKVIQYTKKYETNYKKDYGGDYKYKKNGQNKYYNSYPNKYEGDYKKMKRDQQQQHDVNVHEHKNVEYQKMQHSHVTTDPPDHTKYIAMARYVVHQADWASVATFTIIESIKGFPFTNVVSMSDGPIETSSGIPYFYLTPLDFTHQDISKDNRCTASISLAETGYCADKKWDADDPRCSRVMLSGKIQKVSNDTKEYTFAKNALFTRHPSMAHLPADHGFYVAKLKIGHIVMLDWFGGPQFIEVQDYLNFKPTSTDKAHKIVENVSTHLDTKSVDQDHDLLP